MKREFDIFFYRGIQDTHFDKRKYINKCIVQAEKLSVKNVINELKFIRTQIIEYCSITEMTVPDMTPTGRKGISKPDASILNYVNEEISYYSQLEEININAINKPESKELPALPDCFNDKKYFFDILTHYKISDLFTVLADGSYKWNKSKSLLGGFAHRLFNTGKLKDIIKTNQDLAKVFCTFFDIRFNEVEEKSFQPNRAKTEYFYFIK